MKKIRVLGLPADIARGQVPSPGQKEPIGPCGYYRVKAPFRVLEEQGLAEVEYGAWPLTDVLKFCKAGEYDVILCQRQSMPWHRMMLQKAREYGVAVVYDVDDISLDLSPGNPAYVFFGDNRKRVLGCFHRLMDENKVDEWVAEQWDDDRVWLTAQMNRATYIWMLENADVVSASTEYIATKYQKYADCVIVPNCIEERDWAGVKPRVLPGVNGRKVIGWAGGDSHGPDLRMLVRPLTRLLQRRDVLFFVVGWEGARGLFPESVRGSIVTVGWSSLENYRGWVASFDIGLAPAVDMPTNRAKSAIRVYELALARPGGIPVVVSPWPYAADVHDGMGLIARKPDRWVRCIEMYLDNPVLAAEHAVRLREHVLTEHTYGANAWRWAEVLAKAVQVRRGGVRCHLETL